MLRPDVLLLDEPLAALDPMVRATLQMELKAIFKQICQTVIFVTHDLAEAAWLGDQIVLLRQGRVVQSRHVRYAARTTREQFRIGIHQRPKEAGTGMKALLRIPCRGSARPGARGVFDSTWNQPLLAPKSSPNHTSWPISPNSRLKKRAIRPNTIREWVER